MRSAIDGYLEGLKRDEIIDDYQTEVKVDPDPTTVRVNM